MAKGKARGLADSDGIMFKNVPPGTYNARISKVEDTETGVNSKHPGTPMVRISFRILSEDEALEKRVLFSQIMLPEAEWMSEADSDRQTAAIKRMYIALGLETDGDEYDTDDWMGQECQIVVTEREYPAGSGKMVNNIAEVLEAV